MITLVTRHAPGKDIFPFHSEVHASLTCAYISDQRLYLGKWFKCLLSVSGWTLELSPGRRRSG